MGEKLECLEGNEEDARVKEIRRIRLGESKWRESVCVPPIPCPCPIIRRLPFPREAPFWVKGAQIRGSRVVVHGQFDN